MEKKSFWKRPEGITGGLVLTGVVVGVAVLFERILAALLPLISTPAGLIGLLLGLGALIFFALDAKARNLVWYFYQSLMRWITGLFVKIDPISILKSFIEDLEDSLRNLSKQIGALRGQMRQLKGTMDGNNADIRKYMGLAEHAQKKNDDKSLTLATRKAGRLQEANAKYEALYQRMEVMYRILTKMYENSEIVLEDTKDQVQLKEQEYRAISASHGAIRSAMSIISGDPDQRARFDLALESLASEVSNKVGEMERFMDTSRNLMASIDLQNGVFEEEGLQLLERWERESILPAPNARESKAAEPTLDLNTPPKEVLRQTNDYSQLFD